MSDWMEYMYMQKTKPNNATGVEVKLTVFGPNGYTKDIGSVTTDAYGNFGVTWTPDTPGLYQVVATFAGTNSYGSSSASAYLSVGSAPSASVTPPPTTAPPTTAPPTVAPTPTLSPSPTTAPPPGGIPIEQVYLISAAVVIVVAVAVVAAVLRRRRK
jgi:hypothetical protein